MTVGLIFAQSNKNGYGVGGLNLSNNASSLGAASFGLVPTFSHNVNLNNPATWSNLRYTIISSSYGGRTVESEYSNGEAGFSGLSMIKFVVPFKNKLSFGVEFKPYASQYLIAEQNDLVLGEGTYNYMTKGGGGLSSLNFAVSGALSQFENIAFQLDHIYGSGRAEYFLSDDSRIFTKMNTFSYKGNLASLYASSTRFKDISLYLKLQMTLSPVTASIQKLSIFEDLNGNDIYDITDFPNPAWFEGSRTVEDLKVHSPFLTAFGMDYKLNNNIKLAGEGVFYTENAENAELVSVFNDYIESMSLLSTSAVWQGNRKSRDFTGKLIFRSGLYFENNKMNFSEDKITEYGLNLGFGIKFGLFENQIDFGYSYGTRSGIDGFPAEKIQRMNITLTMGDLWFVKRRAR